MTNKEILAAWDKFLEDELGCYADEFGNRPCDTNEIVCDKCLCMEYEFYSRFRKKVLKNT